MSSTHSGDKDAMPFSQPWIDSSFFETLLPSTPWQNVVPIDMSDCNVIGISCL